jgi:hypothetical protein
MQSLVSRNAQIMMASRELIIKLGAAMLNQQHFGE